MDTSEDKSGARQFSLRKLLLWMAVCAVYLGLLRVTFTEPISAIVVTVWLAVLLIARLWWGLKGGMIAVSVMAVVWGGVVTLISGGGNTPSFFYLCVAGVAMGIPLGLLALVFVVAVVRLVNWIDSLGRKNRPPDS